MEKKNLVRIGVTDILMVIASAVMVIGINTWFKVCEPKSDDMIMSCHWAGETVKVLSILLLALSVLHLLIPSRHIKVGISLSLLGVSLVTMLIPGCVISLCKMEEMSCRSHTQLWTMIICAALTLIAIVDIIIHLASASKEKHMRK